MHLILTWTELTASMPNPYPTCLVISGHFLSLRSGRSGRSGSTVGARIVPTPPARPARELEGLRLGRRICISAMAWYISPVLRFY